MSNPPTANGNPPLVKGMNRRSQILRLLMRYRHSGVFSGMNLDAAGNPADVPADGNPEQFVSDLEALGPTFVKLGQMLSTRPDMVPVEFATALERMQEKVAEIPVERIHAIVEQELGAPASFLADWLGLSGPVYSLSTACTSSARALLSAHRLLQQGLCDAVLCGGVDSLCRLTLNGFSALEAISAERCNPFSANRHGINIGEGAALFVMTKEPVANASSIALLGGGASSDAHHISAPEPTGAGAQAAMRKALASANVAAQEIDYLNLHGTATQHNDAMESLAVQALFPQGVACSSTKPLTGHTLGAAGALEAAFCWLSLSPYNSDGLLPPHLWDGQADPTLPRLPLVDADTRLRRAQGRRLMSNSFAFGGSNLSLIIGDVP